MRELALQSQTLTQACLGKITWHTPWLKSKDYICVAPEAIRPYRAQLTLSARPESAQIAGMAYISADDLSSLKEGDVVLAEPMQAMPTQSGMSDATAVTTTEPATASSKATATGKLVVMLEAETRSNYLSLTDRCNHRCIMCPQPPVKHENSHLQQNLRLIELMSKDTESVGITGGEPTLVGDDLITILQALKKRVPDAAITILTNAVKLADLNFVKKIALVGNHDLQIDVPLFASIPELHNEIVGAKTFYKTVQGLYNLATCQLDIGIRVVVHRLNYQHLTMLAYYIYHNFPFVKQVAFMQMETMGYAEENIQRLWIDPYDYKDQLSAAVNFLRQRQITTLIYNAQLCIINPDVQEVAVKSISEWKNIHLEACQHCSHLKDCPGLFASNQRFHSAHIHALSA